MALGANSWGHRLLFWAQALLVEMILEIGGLEDLPSYSRASYIDPGRLDIKSTLVI
jgi:hypothetical protein